MILGNLRLCTSSYIEVKRETLPMDLREKLNEMEKENFVQPWLGKKASKSLVQADYYEYTATQLPPED